MTFDQLISKIKEKNPRVDTKLIERAYLFAEKAHRGQKRVSGEDYITHPLSTAYTLAELNLDESTLAAALLHDVIDDTPVTIGQIEKEFRKEIAFLVNGVTKLGRAKYRGVEYQAESLRKLFLVMAEDLRVVLIKLADRLHNMETLKALKAEKQRRIALETLEIYAPLADRLGIGEMKGKLEDLAFPFIYPNEYEKVIGMVKEKLEARQLYLERVQEILKKELEQAGIKVIDIHTRAKHLYSLWQKLKKYNMDITKIYDLAAARILVSSIEECYKALGIIHKFFKPLPGYIKDFIALPKLNGYQSLHTTVFCLDGKIIEIQIRTPKMHEAAEHGIAAHWAYTESKGSREYLSRQAIRADEKDLIWVRQLKNWQKKADAKEFLESLKIDFFRDRVFVFTPKGEVKNLPQGATPVDFAYAVHSEIGNHCKAARADGKHVPLNYQLQNYQIIEIITDPRRLGPSPDWLRFVKTTLARSHIKKWQIRYSYSAALKEKIKEVKKELIGFVYKKVYKKKPEISPPKKEKKPIKPALSKVKGTEGEFQISVAGHEGLATKIAKCCLPQKSDEICGYATSRGIISIHKTDCKNLATRENKNKIMPAEWKN